VTCDELISLESFHWGLSAHLALAVTIQSALLRSNCYCPGEKWGDSEAGLPFCDYQRCYSNLIHSCLFPTLNDSEPSFYEIHEYRALADSFLRYCHWVQ